MIYEVTLTRGYYTLTFAFARATDAVSFMHTALETYTPSKSDDANKPLEIKMELKEVNDGEETV